VNEIRVAAIVGGRGEKEALPILFRRIACVLDPSLVVNVQPVLPIPESPLAKAGEIEKSVSFVARTIERRGGIFILLDCDWAGSCPKTDAPIWLERARRARPDKEISLVMANKEYEAWFIAAAESLRGRRGLPTNLTSVANPEGIRGAKEWLSDRMPRSRPYRPITDQPALTSVFDLQAARRADSFDKCYREIVRLLTILGAAK
jgi:hypothetical protein